MFRLTYRLMQLPFRLASVFYKWVLGPYSFVDITSNRSNMETMTITTVDGTTTTIYCVEHRYLCRYKYWYVKNHVVSTYTVSATVFGKASENYIQACSIKHSFPKLLHPWMSSVSQKEAAIEAYMDLMLDYLRKLTNA